jgi:hypothetical protein
MVSLPSTAGACAPLPVELSYALFGSDVTQDGDGGSFAYSLAMFPNGSISLQMICYSLDPATGLCGTCVFEMTTVAAWQGSCTQPSDTTEASSTSLYLQPSDSMCFGSLLPVPSNSLFLAQYNYTTSCAASTKYVGFGLVALRFVLCICFSV